MPSKKPCKIANCLPIKKMHTFEIKSKYSQGYEKFWHNYIDFNHLCQYLW